MAERIKLPSEVGVTESITGGQRSNASGKGRLDLFPPPWSMIRLSQHAEEAMCGVEKGGYDERNWEKGVSLSRYYSSAIRHLAQWYGGLRDEPHFVAAAWNVIAGLETQHRIEIGLLPKELDDRPPASMEKEEWPWRGRVPLEFPWKGGTPGMTGLEDVPAGTLVGVCAACLNRANTYVRYLHPDWNFCPRCGRKVK